MKTASGVILVEVSIHAFRGEGDYRLYVNRVVVAVSIHAFRGEGDARRFVIVDSDHVSIHAFRGEGDGACTICIAMRQLFQSTPSGGKAT